MFRFLFPAALAVMVPAAVHAGGADSVSQVKYVCADNEVLDVVYINTAAGGAYAVIHQAGELIPMQIAPTASGANYAAIDPDYTYQLQTKGDAATLVEGDDKPVLSDCTASN